MDEPLLRQRQPWIDPHTVRPWIVDIRLANVKGRLECVGFTVRSFFDDDAEEQQFGNPPVPPVPAGGLAFAHEPENATGVVNSTVMRRIPVGKLIDAARDELTNMRDQPTRGFHLADYLAAKGLPVSLEQGDEDTRNKIQAAAEEWALKANLRADTIRNRLDVLPGQGPHHGGMTAKPRSHWVEVAEVYDAAHRAGRHPTKAVQEHFTVSYSTGAKWVRRCRQQGLLDRTEQGIARGTLDSKSATGP